MAKEGLDKIVFSFVTNRVVLIDITLQAVSKDQGDVTCKTFSTSTKQSKNLTFITLSLLCFPI